MDTNTSEQNDEPKKSSTSSDVIIYTTCSVVAVLMVFLLVCFLKLVIGDPNVETSSKIGVSVLLCGLVAIPIGVIVLRAIGKM